MSTIARKFITTFVELSLLLGLFGVLPAFAKCDPTKSDNCPTEAPGQVVNNSSSDAPGQVGQDTNATSTVTITLPNDKVKNEKAPANGLVGKVVQSDSSVTIDNTTVGTLPSGTTVTITLNLDTSSGDVAGGTVEDNTSGGGNGTVDLSYLAGTPGYDTNGTPVYTYEQFLAALTYDCPDQICAHAALKNPKGWWMHYPISNLYQDTGNHLTSMCRETSNSNNLLEDENRGWANISWHLYQDYLNKTKVFGDPVEC